MTKLVHGEEELCKQEAARAFAGARRQEPSPPPVSRATAWRSASTSSTCWWVTAVESEGRRLIQQGMTVNEQRIGDIQLVVDSSFLEGRIALRKEKDHHHVVCG